MSNVRAAVAKREQAAVERAAQPSVAQVVRQAIERQSSAFRQVLPNHVDPERYSRLVLTAIKSTPDLMRCFGTPQGETSVLLAAMQAAAVGLEPNTPTQEAWIVPRHNKSVWEARLAIGYRGLLKLARRSGDVKTIYAEVVRENDHFLWSRGLEGDVLDHIPLDGDDEARGDLTHAYAVARFHGGGYAFMVLNRAQIEARRAMSDSWKAQNNASSPWVRWPEAMWRKSAIRALAPFLDLSPQAQHALAIDERPLHFDDEAGVIEVASTFGELTTGDDEPVDVEGQAVAEPASGEPDQ